MTTHARFAAGTMLVVLLLFVRAAGAQQTPAAAPPPPVSPFDKDDPEIARIRALDWKNTDFNSLDPKTRCGALMALNKGLSSIGAKADSRVDLLVDYIDQHELGPTYASAKATIPDPPQVTFDQMERVAAAYAKSPEGAAQLASELPGGSDDMLTRYLALYEKSARREFEETHEARWQVRSMALFLQEQGKLDDFKSWADQEQKRRQDDLAKQEAGQQAATEQQRQERAAEYAKQKQQEQQLASRQMELALQQQQQQQSAASGAGSSQNTSDYDGTLATPYGWAGGYYAYYNSNAYRGYVRDKSQDAYQRWRQNTPRPSQLPAQRPAFNRGGGGFRGGGRR